MLTTAKRWFVNAKKKADRFLDVFRPQGFVEAHLIHAHGPNKGEVYRVIKGQNVVTSWLSGAAPTSGRDLMRRILIPPSFSGQSLSGVTDAWVGQVELGDGTTAETSGDTSLESALSPDSKKAVSSVELDPTNPYVTFIFQYSDAEANVTISEAALLSGPTRNDFIARKTFGSFTKTSDFELQIRWSIRL